MSEFLHSTIGPRVSRRGIPRIRWAWQLAMVVLLALASFVVVTILPAARAGAVSPSVCLSTSEQPRTYLHGSPHTGLVPPNDYYYLGVTPGPACPVGPTVTLVATLQVTAIVKSVGALPGTLPAPTRPQRWFAIFHLGTSSTGVGFGMSNDPTHVGILWNTASTSTCDPLTNMKPEKCLVVSGNRTVVLIYHGPDVFGLSHGGAAGFRIDNMATDGAIVCDYATLQIYK
jgi:hypothetical protein